MSSFCCTFVRYSLNLHLKSKTSLHNCSNIAKLIFINLNVLLYAFLVLVCCSCHSAKQTTAESEGCEKSFCLSDSIVEIDSLKVSYVELDDFIIYGLDVRVEADSSDLFDPLAKEVRRIKIDSLKSRHSTLVSNIRNTSRRSTPIVRRTFSKSSTKSESCSESAYLFDWKFIVLGLFFVLCIFLFRLRK